MRRRNGSKKIPGVILRARPDQPRSGSQDMGPFDELEFDINQPGGAPEPYTARNIQAGERPFSGINISCSGVSNKADLFRFVEELGGTSCLDLVDSTTHLITHGPGSEKYKYALEHQIPLVHPDWVLESHARYVSGEDVNLDEVKGLFHTLHKKQYLPESLTIFIQLLDKHHLKCFQGLRLCILGEDKLEQRHRIARIMEDHGASYSKDVNDSVTHLIICGSAHSPFSPFDDPPIKVREALRLNETRSIPSTPDIPPRKRKYGELSGSAAQEPIYIVWSEWFWDCLHARGRYDEELYDATVQSRPKPRVFCVDASQSTPSFAVELASAQQSSSTQPQSDQNDNECVYMRGSKARTDSDFWMKIKQQQTRSKQFLPGDVPKAGGDTALASFIPSTTIQDGTLLPPKTSLSRMSSTRTFEIGEPGPSSERHGAHRAFNRASSKEIVQGEVQIFSGLVFGALGDNHQRNDVLKREVHARGGRFLNDVMPSQALELAQVVIVALEDTPHLVVENERHKSKLRTECWFERCIFEDRIIPGDDHIVYTPLKVKLPIQGVDKLRIAFSGLNNMDTIYLKRFSRAIGLCIPNVSKRNSITHMVCPSRMGQKYEKAIEWGIPVVDLEWVYGLAMQQDPSPSLSSVLDTDAGAVADITNGMILLDGKRRVRSPSQTRSPRARRGPESSPCKAVGIMPERFVTPQSPTRPRIATAHAIRTSRSPGLPRASGQQRSVTPSKRTPRGAKRINSLPNSEVNTPKKTRSGSVVPSSQSPSPLKSPTAKAVRDQLVSILEDHNERGRQASLSEDKGSRSVSVNSNNPFPRKKARPLRRHKTNTDVLPVSQSGSMTTSTSALSISDRDAQRSWSKFQPRMEDSGSPHYDVAADEDSLRVQYLDPGQKAAKDHLMALIGKDPGDDETEHPNEDTKESAPKLSAKSGPTPKPIRKRGGIPTRRSARKSGF